MYPLDGLRDVFLEALHDGKFPQHYIGSYEKVLVEKWNDALHEFNKRYDINHKGEWRYANHGKWIQNRAVWNCSLCGKNPTHGMGYTQGKDNLFPYCPNCGAKMDGAIEME